jgi:hypothetical protein
MRGWVHLPRATDNLAGIIAAQLRCTSLTVSSTDIGILHHAAALGADWLIHVEGGSLSDTLNRIHDVDLVLLPHDHRQLTVEGWDGPYVAGVAAIEGVEEGQVIVRQRHFGGWTVIQCRLPALLTVRPSIATVPFVLPDPSAKVEPWSLTSVDVTPTSQAHQVIDTAEELYDILHQHDLIGDQSPGSLGATVEQTIADDTPLSLTDAPVIIAGGMGLANHDGPGDFAERVRHSFDTLLYTLAQAFCGTVASSRAVIDSAGLPAHYLVGQSGRRVAPRLYLAAGISGQPQHIQAIEDAELIIAINPDENAPIHTVAHISLYKDAVSVLQELLDLHRTNADL